MESKIEEINHLRKQENIDEFSPIIKNTMEELFLECINEIVPIYASQIQHPFPKITLSMKKENAMGYYFAKRIGIILPSFGKLLFMKFDEERSSKECYDILSARMTFTILHELGHHIDYLENEQSKNEARENFTKLKKLFKGKSLNEIIQCRETEELLLSDNKHYVKQEVDADNFAYSIMENHLPHLYKQEDFVEFKTKRPLIYRNYSADRIASIILMKITHIPAEEKKIIAKHYLRIALNL